MSLPKVNNTPSTAFEAEDETVAAPAAAKSVAAKSTAVAVKSSNAVAVATKASELAKLVTEIKDKLPLAYGDAPTFKAKSGGQIVGGNSATEATKLGRWIQVSLLSWSDRQEISPGSDSPDAKDLVAYSEDNLTVTNILGDDMAEHVGKTIPEYLKVLREEYNMPKAAARRMVDLLVYVLDAEKSTDYTNSTAIITLPPSSIRSFDGYMSKLSQIALAQARGLPVKVPEDPLTFFLYCEGASKDGKEWTKLSVSTTLPKDL